VVLVFSDCAHAFDVGWMQKGVRVWYLGGVDGSGPTASNAEEAYHIDGMFETAIEITHHSALDHWKMPQPVAKQTYPLNTGPFWIHPSALQELEIGDYWMGQEITLITRSNYTYDTFVYRLLPAKALFDLQPTRQIVKLSYMIPGFSTGNAYFDADTGLLLYYHTLWGTNKMFFILGEINYDFAAHKAFAEDYGPHTGFKSFVSEQSMGDFSTMTGGGSVIIQALVETRYGKTVEMRVLGSLSGPAGGPPMSDENYCFFGSVPILRYMDAQQAPNYPPEQWNPMGEYLWWYIPPSDLGKTSINVLDVNMTKTSASPPTFTATETPARFYFSMLQFNALGYLTLFSAKDTRYGIDINPGDWLFQNNTTVDGLDYYINTMGRAVPETARPLSMPGITNLLLLD
jgi:hypothetical protein